MHRLEGMRLFIALDLSDALHARVAAAVERERQQLDARWVPPDHLHLTLVFLGDTEPTRVPEILSTSQAVAARHSRFTLTLEGAGTFGARSHPRVLWLGVTGAIQDLVADLERGLARPSERPWQAHLTLARARSFRGDPKLLAAAERLKPEHFGSWEVDHLTLYESVGGRYRALGTATLT